MRKVAIGIVLYLIWFGFALFMQEAIIKDYQPMPQQEGFEICQERNNRMSDYLAMRYTTNKRIVYLLEAYDK